MTELHTRYYIKSAKYYFLGYIYFSLRFDMLLQYISKYSGLLVHYVQELVENLEMKRWSDQSTSKLPFVIVA